MDPISILLFWFWYSFQDVETILMLIRSIELSKYALSSYYFSDSAKFNILLYLIRDEINAHFIPFAIIIVTIMFIFMAIQDNKSRGK